MIDLVNPEHHNRVHNPIRNIKGNEMKLFISTSMKTEICITYLKYILPVQLNYYPSAQYFNYILSLMN